MNAKILLDYLNEFKNPENVEICFGIVDGNSGEWYDLEVDLESTINGTNNEYVIEIKENKKYLKDKFGFPIEKLIDLNNAIDDTLDVFHEDFV